MKNSRTAKTAAAAKEVTSKAAATAKKVVEDTVKEVKPVVAEVKKAAEPVVKETVKAAEKAVEKADEVIKEAAAKCSSQKVEEQVYLQYLGKEINSKEIVEAAKKASGEKKITSVTVYLKPEENKAYYVVNGDVTGSIEL